MSRPDAGVPEALPRVLEVVRERLGVERVDRLWIFPPLVQGRKEWGLVAVACFTSREDLRDLLTARYAAETTGRGTVVSPDLNLEGSASPERLARVVEGVGRRWDRSPGDPRLVLIEGDPGRYAELLRDVGASSREEGTEEP